MKVSGQTTIRQVMRGTISERELLALVRLTLEIPESANVRFFARGYGNEVDIDEEDPLQFTASWEDQGRPTPDRSIPLHIPVPRENTEPHG